MSVYDIEQADLLKLLTDTSVPGFVKAASVDVLTPPVTAANVYADIPHSRFPCHTAAATWLSCLAFNAKRANYSPAAAAGIAERLKFACESWHIEPPQPITNHPASDDADYACVLTHSGVTSRFAAIRTAEECEKAAAWLNQHRDEMPAAVRQKTAAAILDRASALGTTLAERESLEKTARRASPSPATIKDQLTKRAACVRSPRKQEQLLKLATAISDTCDEKLANDLVEVISDVDNQTQVAYGEIFLRPEEAVYGATVAVAEPVKYVKFANGSRLTHQAVKDIPAAKLAAALGPDVAAAVNTPFGPDPDELQRQLSAMSPKDGDKAADILL
jgi:hypothetical protein